MNVPKLRKRLASRALHLASVHGTKPVSARLIK